MAPLSHLVICLFVSAWVTSSLCAEEPSIVLRNPSKSAQTQIPMRVAEAETMQPTAVLNGEKTLPSQWEASAGGYTLWALMDLPAGSKQELQLVKGPDQSADKGLLHVLQEGDWYILSNGIISVRIPAKIPQQNGSIPAPIVAMKSLEGPWIGKGTWQGVADLAAYSAEILGHGPVQLTLLQHYEFVDGSSLRCRLRLRPGRDFIEIEERIQLPTGAAWTFDVAAGSDAWKPQASLYTQHGGGAGKPFDSGVKSGSLLPGQSRMGDTLVYLLPRWSQAVDDGWLAAASDGQQAIGALAVRAGQWQWPHRVKIAAEVEDHGQALRLHMPGNSGAFSSVPVPSARMWWLRIAPTAAWSTARVQRLAMDFAMADLDKLNRQYILDGFPDGAKATLPHPFQGIHVNPTGMWRQQARREHRSMNKAANYSDLVWAQAVLDPDFFGTPWYGWSVQNPNFWTDILQRPALRIARLHHHPRFTELRQFIELSLRSDLYHSVTLPGGAGQECPGYQGHALKVWDKVGSSTHKQLGFDLRKWPRFTASHSFLQRISQPDGGTKRRMLPIGDTHPDRKHGTGPIEVQVSRRAVQKWVSESFPGFGVILRHKPGTKQESYVSFKVGPNRGHYHGDQLSLHWNAHAKPLMVDHHASYAPRVGQEHMHNRLSFGTKQMPWATMDGYERLMGFESHPDVDVAHGQVQSHRLRRTPQFPPEEWDQRHDIQDLGGVLTYDRTLLLLKGLEQDALLLIDRWQAPQPIRASFNAHIRGQNVEEQANVLRVDDIFSATRIMPQDAELERLDWSHDNGGREATVGLRWTKEERSGTMVTLLWPGNNPPPVQQINEQTISIKDYRIEFGQQENGQCFVIVNKAGKELIHLVAQEGLSQGGVGIFVPDAGYPFGPIPKWLRDERLTRPKWAQNLPTLLDPLEDF